MKCRSLDSRIWILWAIAVIVPLLLTRHPLLVLEQGVIVGLVRIAVPGRGPDRWGWVVRVGGLFLLLGVVLNVLTVHSGAQVIGTIPESIPVIGGAVTWNAVAYGVISGLVGLILIVTGATAAAHLDWTMLMRQLPAGARSFAVAGSVAWSFLPGATSAFREIRESQVARGLPVSRGIHAAALVVPLLEGSLDRALTMSEALEARGFGHTKNDADIRRSSPCSMWLLAGSLAFAAMAGYAVIAGHNALVGIAVLIAIALAIPAFQQSAVGTLTTAYRRRSLTRIDRVVGGAFALSIMIVVVRRWMLPEHFAFNPYPDIAIPAPDLLSMIALAVLIAPALVFPDGTA